MRERLKEKPPDHPEFQKILTVSVVVSEAKLSRIRRWFYRPRLKSKVTTHLMDFLMDPMSNEPESEVSIELTAVIWKIP